ncbi:MAG: hypothetical protein KC777_30250, partial [Cyanobacteria bacterium HKST-UBA02]|nr:hypothetical protein [Cyanobacteria bacterium HKST-UBA02]
MRNCVMVGLFISYSFIGGIAQACIGYCGDAWRCECPQFCAVAGTLCSDGLCGCSHPICSAACDDGQFITYQLCGGGSPCQVRNKKPETPKNHSSSVQLAGKDVISLRGADFRWAIFSKDNVEGTQFTILSTNDLHYATEFIEENGRIDAKRDLILISEPVFENYSKVMADIQIDLPSPRGTVSGNASIFFEAESSQSGQIEYLDVIYTTGSFNFNQFHNYIVEKLELVPFKASSFNSRLKFLGTANITDNSLK